MLQVTQAQDTPFGTPGQSAATIITGMQGITMQSRDGSPAPADKKSKAPETDNILTPASKRNRDYLPKEAKPVYFELKKHYKKMAQWEAHKRFAENSATTGNIPRSLRWSPPTPWAFTNTALNTRWATITLKAQTELCALVAEDCTLKVKQHEASIKSLLNDFAGLIPESDFQEISNELLHSFSLAVEKKYAEKILTRSTATTKASGQKNFRKPATKNKKAVKPQRFKRTAQRQGKQKKNATTKPNAIQKQIQKLTDALTKLK